MSPIAKITTPMKSELPTPTAPIASGPKDPTISVSTIPIVIHPSSARTTGNASVNIGRNSGRSVRKRGSMAAKDCTGIAGAG